MPKKSKYFSLICCVACGIFYHMKIDYIDICITRKFFLILQDLIICYNKNINLFIDIAIVLWWNQRIILVIHFKGETIIVVVI